MNTYLEHPDSGVADFCLRKLEPSFPHLQTINLAKVAREAKSVGALPPPPPLPPSRCSTEDSDYPYGRGLKLSDLFHLLGQEHEIRSCDVSPRTRRLFRQFLVDLELADALGVFDDFTGGTRC